MATKNFYPQFPEVPYQKTFIDMPSVVLFAKTLIGKYPLEVVRAAYIIFRNESGNGKYGVNNNYIGLQADNAIWQGLDLSNVVGTSIKKDNAGDIRRFICFNENGYQTCFDFLCYKVQQRGIYIGADGVHTPDDLAMQYELKWVANEKENTPANRAGIVALYQSATKNIN